MEEFKYIIIKPYVANNKADYDRFNITIQYNQSALVRPFCTLSELLDEIKQSLSKEISQEGGEVKDETI